MNEKYCVTIEDVYGVPFAELSAPQGYEFTGEFRPAKDRETMLAVGANIVSTIYTTKETKQYPRLILRALPTVESVYGGQTLERLKENSKTADCWFYPDLKFEWTGEFRKVEKGEYFLSAPEGKSVVWNDSNIFTKTYRLIMRKCPTIKEIYDKELSELTPPIGYRFTGEFRNPTADDDCLFPFGGCSVVKYAWIRPEDVKLLGPRLILEKLPATPTIKDVYATDKPAIPKGWKMKEFRRIEDGEEVVWLAAFGTGIICNDTKGNPFRYEGRRYDVQKWRIVLEKEDEVVDLSKLTYPVTPEYIYGPTLPKVPPGYKVVGFRPPLRDELYLSVYGGSPEVAPAEFDRPRLILSPLGPR